MHMIIFKSKITKEIVIILHSKTSNEKKKRTQIVETRSLSEEDHRLRLKGTIRLF